MGMYGTLVKKYFESQGLKYRELPDDNNVVLRVGFNGKNKPELEALLFINEEGHNVALRSFNYCSVPEEKKNAIYKVCSDMNHQFRWVKFYVDEKDNTVSVEDDAILAEENAGDECMELCIRMIKICDDAYPAFMRAIYA